MENIPDRYKRDPNRYGRPAQKEPIVQRFVEGEKKLYHENKVEFVAENAIRGIITVAIGVFVLTLVLSLNSITYQATVNALQNEGSNNSAANMSAAMGALQAECHVDPFANCQGLTSTVTTTIPPELWQFDVYTCTGGMPLNYTMITTEQGMPSNAYIISEVPFGMYLQPGGAYKFSFYSPANQLVGNVLTNITAQPMVIIALPCSNSIN